MDSDPTKGTLSDEEVKRQIMDNLESAIMAFEVEICWRTASRLRNILKAQDASATVAKLWPETLQRKKNRAELWFQGGTI